jgi:hypothetical protein
MTGGTSRLSVCGGLWTRFINRYQMKSIQLDKPITHSARTRYTSA